MSCLQEGAAAAQSAGTTAPEPAMQNLLHTTLLYGIVGDIAWPSWHPLPRDLP